MVAFNLKKAQAEEYPILSQEDAQNVVSQVIEKPFGLLLKITLAGYPKPIWIKAYYRDYMELNEFQWAEENYKYPYYFQPNVIKEISEKYYNASVYVQEQQSNQPEPEPEPPKDEQLDLFSSTGSWYKVSQDSSVLICIDIQQEANDYIGFDYCELANFMSQYASVVYVVDENMAGGTIEPDLHPNVREYYEESAGSDLNPEDYEDEDQYFEELEEAKYCSIPSHIDIKVKAYGGILRTAIDAGTDDEAIEFFKALLSGKEINPKDYEDFIESFMVEYGRGDFDEAFDELQHMSTELIHGIPNDFWKSLGSSVDICGGGVNECLREVQMALEILGIEYNTIGKFTYSKNNQKYKTANIPEGLRYDDPDEYGEEAYQLAQKYFNVLSNTELKAVIVNEMDQVVGALFTDETNSDNFSFDVVVHPDYQRLGIGKDLVDYAVSIFEELKKVYGDDYYIDVHVINPNMRKLLEDHYGFEVDKNLNQSDVTMRYQENEKWYKVSENMKIVFKDDFPPEADQLIEDQDWSILLTDSNISKFNFDTEDIRKIVNIILAQEDTKRVVDILADLIRRQLITKSDPEYQEIMDVMDLVLQPSDWDRMKQIGIIKDEQIEEFKQEFADMDEEEPDSEMWDEELEGNLISVELIKEKVPLLVAKAQEIYDEWEQDENGEDVEYGVGGICHIIAENFVDILYHELEIPATTVHQEIGENHVYVVFAAEEGVFSLDIHPYVYESGGGYNWKKLPDVKFDTSHVEISKLDGDPKEFKNYVGE